MESWNQFLNYPTGHPAMQKLLCRYVIVISYSQYHSTNHEKTTKNDPYQ